MRYKTRFFLFFLAIVIFNLAANFAHPVTPTVIQELGLHDYMFGLALAAMMLTNFLLSPFWGKINTYISSRTSLLISCFGYGIAQLWFAYADSELMIVLARMFAGLFTGGAFVSSGIIPADITYEFLDILSLGISVHGTGILADRKPLGSCKGCDVSFLSK